MELTVSYEGKYEGKGDEELYEILEKMKEESAGKYAHGEEYLDFDDFMEDTVEERIRKQRENEILWLESKVFMGNAVEISME